MNNELKSLLLSLVDIMHMEIQQSDEEIKCKKEFILAILKHVHKSS